MKFFRLSCVSNLLFWWICLSVEPLIGDALRLHHLLNLISLRIVLFSLGVVCLHLQVANSLHLVYPKELSTQKCFHYTYQFLSFEGFLFFPFFLLHFVCFKWMILKPLYWAICTCFFSAHNNFLTQQQTHFMAVKHKL